MPPIIRSSGVSVCLMHVVVDLCEADTPLLMAAKQTDWGVACWNDGTASGAVAMCYCPMGLVPAVLRFCSF
jgi:hypothetical protein